MTSPSDPSAFERLTGFRREPVPLREPGTMAKACIRVLCTDRPVGDRWVKVSGLSVGGYWAPMCARHWAEFDSPSEDTQPERGEQDGGGEEGRDEDG